MSDKESAGAKAARLIEQLESMAPDRAAHHLQSLEESVESARRKKK